jgi:hypothetical protein
MAVFCALAKNVDNCVSMIWQQDGAPGYSVPPNGQHAIQSNDIVYDCIDPNLVLGINDASNNPVRSVNVFPNPASDQLTISIQNDGLKECRLEIRNIVGQTVWTSLEQNVLAGVLRLDVDVKELASGMYTLRVADDQNARTVKFVKN